ncbi:aldose epimerase family protein [Roseobacter ponti]|uniref:Galactose mutarotase n=1 Tax=Roseobacter ponti TaxID=1891787 RepID=A0A858STH4_9RHOB|nr:aldose epimerase family protein [Roseobacter ponti]QJF51013.1 galactose mutarotase [Roseobacter ponti]
MITLQSRDLRATILQRGATLTGLWHCSSDRALVLGSPDASRYDGDLLYAGAIVGPLANRISGAFVTIAGQKWALPANEGANCLHNGPGGLHSLRWDTTEQSEVSVTLQADLPHGATGLPGNRRITARYRLTPDGALELILEAVTDRPTLMNPAHHPYWTLSSHGADAHSLQVNATEFTETDAENLPTGQVLPVAGTAFDFTSERRMPADRTIDVNLCLAGQTAAAPRPVAKLTGDDGMRLEIETTAPGLQVYNASGLARSDIAMHPRQRLEPFAGIALEPQGWPDAPGRPDFPSVDLHPGTPFRQHTIYRIFR